MHTTTRGEREFRACGSQGRYYWPRYRVFYGERDLYCFWAFLKRYLGVLILVTGCFLKGFVPRFLFLTVCPRSWILVPGVLVPGVLVPDVRVLGVSIGVVLEVLGCLASCELWLDILKMFRGRVYARG
jgi:hypothetical protein